MGTSKYLRKMNLFFIMSSAELDESAVYIKILLNFLQISTAAKNMKMQIPSIFDFLSEKVGTPI
jgi:hypothetical protein